jgi:hypothetical protein
MGSGQFAALAKHTTSYARNSPDNSSHVRNSILG